MGSENVPSKEGEAAADVLNGTAAMANPKAELIATRRSTWGARAVTLGSSNAVAANERSFIMAGGCCGMGCCAR